MSNSGFTIPGMTSCGCGGSGGSCACAPEQQSDTSRPAFGVIPGFGPLGGGAHAYGGPAGGGLVPGMEWADPAEPPVLLHPPLFPPPGMLSTMQADEVAGGKRGQGGSGSQPGVTVTRSKECEYIITLAVYIFPGSDPSGRGRMLLQRVKKLLSKMGPWDCCPKDEPRCTVKLALDIVAKPASAGKKGGGAIQARFYNNEEERVGNMVISDEARAAGTTSDAFGLHRLNDGSIEIPSISEWAGERIQRSWGGLIGLSGESVPETGRAYDGPIPGDGLVGVEDYPADRTRAMQLIFAYDILAIIIHEILHAMGAGHDNDDQTPNIMNEVWKTGTSGAFRITTKTACQIGSKNGACTGLLRIGCCKPADGRKRRLFVPMDGFFIIPWSSLSGSTGNVGSAGYRSRWTMPFSQEGMGISTVPPSGMHGP